MPLARYPRPPARGVLPLAGVRFDLLNRALGNRRIRLEALRYESACDLQSLKSAEEYCDIQRRLTGGVSVKAALKCGTRRMMVERKDRDTNWEYDRGTLAFAYGQLKETTRFPKTKLFL